jgi:signal transduction histidine kinase
VSLPGFHSLRSRFLFVAFVGVLLPFAGVAAWLNGSAGRSGAELLRQRLDATLVEAVRESGKRWVVLRTALLDIADDPAIQDALSQGSASTTASGAPMIRVRALDPGSAFFGALVAPVTLIATEGSMTWRLHTSEDSTVADSGAAEGTRLSSLVPGISVSVPVHARATGVLIGRLETRVSPETLVPSGVGGAHGVGVLLEVVDRATGQSLSSLPFDPRLMREGTFALGGERWLVRHRTLEEPAIILAAAAPLVAYTLPFQEAARKGGLTVLVVAVASMLLATLLIRRVTHSLEELATATQAVAAGDLDRRVSERSDSEVGQVGGAFNAMTESLRGTLRRLSQREALAAVGEFASSVAHEVRNPLTAIRIDLQRLDETLPADSPLRTNLHRALREVQRLDQIMSGALRIARSGAITTELVDLRVPLSRAIEMAAPAFATSGGVLRPAEIGAGALAVRGDEAALEQVFLNVLLNAAQSLEVDGEAGVSVAVDGKTAQVDIWDTGVGIDPEQLRSVFDPFMSTKREGTGLGLSVARQIVLAHGGTISIDSAVEAGTTVSIQLPLEGAGDPGKERDRAR